LPHGTPGTTSISIAAIADTFETCCRYRLSAIVLDGNVAIDFSNSFLTISLMIIGHIFREYCLQTWGHGRLEASSPVKFSDNPLVNCQYIFVLEKISGLLIKKFKYFCGNVNHLNMLQNFSLRLMFTALTLARFRSYRLNLGLFLCLLPCQVSSVSNTYGTYFGIFIIITTTCFSLY